MGGSSRKNMTDKTGNNIKLRELQKEDAQMIFEWRNSDFISKVGSLQKKVSWKEHQNWILSAIKDTKKVIYIIQNHGTDVGQIRFEKDNDDSTQASISIYVIEPYLKKGIGLESLNIACKMIFQYWNDLQQIDALVREENLKSQSFFTKAVFLYSNNQHIKQHKIYHFYKSDFLK